MAVNKTGISIRTLAVVSFLVMVMQSGGSLLDRALRRQWYWRLATLA
jgi:hypothetical protein